MCEGTAAAGNAMRHGPLLHNATRVVKGKTNTSNNARHADGQQTTDAGEQGRVFKYTVT